MEGKNLWKKFIPGNGKEESTTPEVEITTEDMERDLKLLKDRIDDPEETDEKLTLLAVERLLNLMEKNPDVKSKLESYLEEYEKRENNDKDYEEEKEVRFMKNDSIYEKIKEGLQRQRLGKFYYNKDNPRRRLGS